jgi:hypothetical protein
MGLEKSSTSPEPTQKSTEVVDSSNAQLLMNRVNKVLKNKDYHKFNVSQEKYKIDIKLFKQKDSKKNYLKVNFSSKGSDDIKIFNYLFSKDDSGKVKIESSSPSDSKIPKLNDKKISKIYDLVLDNS